MKKIEFVDLSLKFKKHLPAFRECLERVLDSGSYILGNEVKGLEAAIKKYTGAQYAVAVANGTDALYLSLKAAKIGAGDEVITTPMSYLATTSSIALSGATAVFVDVDSSLNLNPSAVEAAINERTRAISVVHLSGIPADILTLKKLADKYQLTLIEDCAQSFGATISGKHTGTFGRFGAVSFHPLKNFGTIGDGGIILVERKEDYEWLLKARNHGHISRDECEFWSLNSRLDELHAAFLTAMLPSYAKELLRRRSLAEIYLLELKDCCRFPKQYKSSSASYTWCMVLVDFRDELMEYLKSKGIDLKIHYPQLISDLQASDSQTKYSGTLSNAKKFVNQILSLPVGDHIQSSDVRMISGYIREFYSRC